MIKRDLPAIYQRDSIHPKPNAISSTKLHNPVMLSLRANQSTKISGDTRDKRNTLRGTFRRMIITSMSTISNKSRIWQLVMIVPDILAEKRSPNFRLSAWTILKIIGISFQCRIWSFPSKKNEVELCVIVII